jgi:hypothetical protein
MHNGKHSPTAQKENGKTAKEMCHLASDGALARRIRHGIHGEYGGGVY